MFEIDYAESGEIICSGRLDAAQSAKAEAPKAPDPKPDFPPGLAGEGAG